MPADVDFRTCYFAQRWAQKMGAQATANKCFADVYIIDRIEVGSRKFLCSKVSRFAYITYHYG